VAGAADTIAAIATPPGRGGVGIVRVSGPAAATVAGQLLPRLPGPRHAEYLPFLGADGEPLDRGIVLYFPAPHSLTGEHVLELQGHGGPVVLDLVLQRILGLGVRPARPGEFSERAFLNGKLDLAQAEAIADLIDGASQQAARSALRSLEGALSDQVNALAEDLVQLRVHVESAIDFADEDIDLLVPGQIAPRLQALLDRLRTLLRQAEQGSLLREGMTAVIAGRPNVGKSSLLNQLARRESAIVTDLPGTTRDLLREHISLDGLPLHIIDTAGLRETGDVVEQEGVRRAWEAIHSADRLLLLVDDRDGIGPYERQVLERVAGSPPVTVVRNKIDLTGTPPGLSDGALGPEVALCAKTGSGLDGLRRHLEQVMGYHGEGSFTARRRHLDALRRAQILLMETAGRYAVDQAGELLAEDLRQAQHCLGEITGEYTSDELLGQIFATFCIGK